MADVNDLRSLTCNSEEGQVIRCAMRQSCVQARPKCHEEIYQQSNAWTSRGELQNVEFEQNA